MTCLARGSESRTKRSISRSIATFFSAGSPSIGSTAGYRLRPATVMRWPPACVAPSRLIARAAPADSSSDSARMSSEYAKPVFSPLTARTPTPCSIECAPSLTMPSSTVQLSRRLCWKYRSPKSTPGPISRVKQRSSSPRPRPAGWSRRDWASSSIWVMGCPEVEDGLGIEGSTFNKKTDSSSRRRPGPSALSRRPLHGCRTSAQRDRVPINQCGHPIPTSRPARRRSWCRRRSAARRAALGDDDLRLFP